MAEGENEVVNRGLRDDKERKWEQVQIKAFKIWINSYLNQKGLSVENVEEDLKTGVNLCTFLELATKKKLPRWTAKPSMRVHKIENVSIALQFIQAKDGLGVRLVSIGAEDVVDGRVNLTLGLLWSLFRKLRIDVISEEGKSSEDGLLSWIKKMTNGYPNVKVTNFKDSFNDGMAFSALIHAINPEVIDFDSLDISQPEKNLIQAFEIAETKLGIPKLLDVEDLLSGNADERAITLYTSLFFHAYVADEERRKLEAQFKQSKNTVAEQIAVLESKLQTEIEEKEKFMRIAESLEEEQSRLNEKILEKERESSSIIAALEQRIKELLAEIEFLKKERAHETEMRFLLEDKIGVLECLLEEKNEENRVKSTEHSEERLKLVAELEEIKKRSKEMGGEVDDLEQENKRLFTDAEEKARRLNEMEERRNKLLAEINALKERVNKEIELRKKKSAELESLKKELETIKSKQIVQNQARIGLDVLKKNLEEHLEDLYRWRDLHEVEFKEGLEDFDLNKVISDLSSKSFEDQLSYLDGKLQEENKALSRIVKLKDSKAQLSETIIKAGWLVMKGRKEWKKRWFKLAGDRLTYYEDDASTDVAGMIQLDQGCEVLRQKALKDEENPAKKLWPLKVTVGDRKLFIRAANKKERHSWFLVLTSKIAHLNYVKATEDSKERPDTRIVGTFAANKVPALNLSNRPITANAISALVKGLPGRDELEDLSLEHSDLDDEKLTNLCEVIEKLQIKTFNFANNSLRDISKFAHFLTPAITALYLSNNQLTAESITPLLKSIKSNQNINFLELQGNPLGPEGARVLASEFGNLNFPSLNLSSTHLGDEGVKELSSLLSSKPFTKINLAKNQISDKGVEILVNALKDSQVEELDLSNNNFGSEGAAHVRSLLKSNPNLIKVHLSGNSAIVTGESLASLLSSGDFKLPEFTLSRV